MIYRFLKSEDSGIIYKTFMKAFSDYQVRIAITEEQFRVMNVRRGLDYGLSIGAFDDRNNNLMVGLLLTGIDLWDGKSTAYDMGTGVIQEYRRKGIGGRMLDFLLPRLRKAKIEQYLLEVIKSNKTALDLYRKKGFKKSRRFECFRINQSKLKLKNTREKVNIEKIEEPDWNTLQSCWSWKPSWQNSINSMTRCQEKKIILGAFQKDNVKGYGIIYPDSGDITQLAVSRKYRRKGIGTQLLMEFSRDIETDKMVAFNVDSSSKETTLFFENAGFEKFIEQYEMIMEL